MVMISFYLATSIKILSPKQSHSDDILGIRISAYAFCRSMIYPIKTSLSDPPIPKFISFSYAKYINPKPNIPKNLNQFQYQL